MKKILILLMSFMLILVGCSSLTNSKINELELKTKEIAESYGLKDVEGEISSRTGVWHYAISGKFKDNISKKPNNSSKEDWYNEHPGDDDWKNVVDGLTKLYGDDE